jgi:hypothetical protein
VLETRLSELVELIWYTESMSAVAPITNRCFPEVPRENRRISFLAWEASARSERLGIDTEARDGSYTRMPAYRNLPEATSAILGAINWTGNGDPGRAESAPVEFPGRRWRYAEAAFSHTILASVSLRRFLQGLQKG